MLRRQRQTYFKKLRIEGHTTTQEPRSQALEGGTRSVDEDDGETSLCFFKKEMETIMETRSAEMFLVHASVFPFDLTTRGELLMYHHGCLRPIAKTPFSQGL